MRVRVPPVVLLVILLASVPPALGGLPGDDAGSGADAPDAPAGAPLVEPGLVYDGVGLAGLDPDHYAFAGRAGDRVQLSALPLGACAWSVLNPDGSNAGARCLVNEDGSQTYEATLVQTGTHHFRLDLGSGPYRFGFNRNGPAPSLLGLEARLPEGDDPTCGSGGAAPTATHGETPEGLVFAALKTGFRAVVAWETAEPVAASLRYNVSGGLDHVATERAARTRHVFVLDRLPEGASLCFEAEGHAPQALLLANAMTAYDASAGAYTMNLLVASNENVRGRDLVEAGLARAASVVHDATDGHVRFGRVVVAFGDVERHNTGTYTCGYLSLLDPTLPTDTPTCDRTVDAVFAHDSCAASGACAQSDGIQSPTGLVMMNSVYQASPVLTDVFWNESEVGFTFAHELGHYVFGMDDLYPGAGESMDCWDPATGLSLLGGTRGATELDDETNRCPNEAEIAGYVPSWTYLRARFPQVPDRAVIDLGPHGPGPAFRLHAFHVTEALPEPGVLEDDAGSGRDAPSGVQDAVPVAFDETHRGTLAPYVDVADAYVVESTPGRLVRLTVLPGAVCPNLMDSQGVRREFGCDVVPGGVEVFGVVPADGFLFPYFALGTSPAYAFELTLE